MCSYSKVTYVNLKQTFELSEIVLVNFIFLTDEEREMVRNWRNHETISKCMYNDELINEEEHKSFVINLKNDNKNAYWLVKDKIECKYIRVIYLNRIDFNNKNAYLGIYANPFLNKSGTGKLLMNALLEVAFNISGFHSLKLEVIEDNERAIGFYKKSGFKEEGRLKEFVFKFNKWKDVIIMGIINM